MDTFENVSIDSFSGMSLPSYIESLTERIADACVPGDARLMRPALLEELLSRSCPLAEEDKLLAAGQIKELIDAREAELEASEAAKLAARAQEKAIREAMGIGPKGAEVARVYTPRGSIFASDSLKARAQVVGPDFFAQLVKEAEAMQAERRVEPKPGTALDAIGLPERPTAEQYRLAADAGQRRPYARRPTPYSFIASLAVNVACGRTFFEDIRFDQILRKGGTLAEWAFNAARYVNKELGASALSRDVQDGLKDIDQGRRS